MRISDWSSDVCSSDLPHCLRGVTDKVKKGPSTASLWSIIDLSGRTSTSWLTLLSSRREPSLLGHWHKLDGASGHQGGIHFHKHGTARGRATEAGLEQRPAEELEIASFCATHRRRQRESGDIGVALCRDELDDIGRASCRDRGWQ